MNHKYIDLFTHNFPTAVLGLAAMFGLDSQESSLLLQTLTTIITAIITLIPIAVHVYRNIETNNMAIKLDKLDPKNVITSMTDLAPKVEELVKDNLSKADQAKVNAVEAKALAVEKDLASFKTNYKVDLNNTQGFAKDAALAVEKGLSDKIASLTQDVNVLKSKSKPVASGTDVINTLSDLLNQAKLQALASSAPTVQPVSKTVTNTTSVSSNNAAG